MKVTEEKDIDGLACTSVSMPPTQAIRLHGKLIRALRNSLPRLKSLLARFGDKLNVEAVQSMSVADQAEILFEHGLPIVGDLFDAVTDDEFNELLRSILINTSVVTIDERGQPRRTELRGNQEIDRVFMSRPRTLYKVAIWAAWHNVAPLFSGALDGASVDQTQRSG